MTPYVYKKRSAGIFYYVAVGLISFILGWQATVSGFIDYKDDELASKTKMANLDKEVSFGVDMNLFWRVWGELEDKYVEKYIGKFDSKEIERIVESFLRTKVYEKTH